MVVIYVNIICCYPGILTLYGYYVSSFADMIFTVEKTNVDWKIKEAHWLSNQKEL